MRSMTCTPCSTPAPSFSCTFAHCSLIFRPTSCSTPLTCSAPVLVALCLSQRQHSSTISIRLITGQTAKDKSLKTEILQPLHLICLSWVFTLETGTTNHTDHAISCTVMFYYVLLSAAVARLTAAARSSPLDSRRCPIETYIQT